MTQQVVERTYDIPHRDDTTHRPHTPSHVQGGPSVSQADTTPQQHKPSHVHSEPAVSQAERNDTETIAEHCKVRD